MCCVKTVTLNNIVISISNHGSFLLWFCWPKCHDFEQQSIRKGQWCVGTSQFGYDITWHCFVHLATRGADRQSNNEFGWGSCLTHDHRNTERVRQHWGVCWRSRHGSATHDIGGWDPRANGDGGPLDKLWRRFRWVNSHIYLHMATSFTSVTCIVEWLCSLCYFMFQHLYGTLTWELVYFKSFRCLCLLFPNHYSFVCLKTKICFTLMLVT